jgi:hypothetical protein
MEALQLLDQFSDLQFISSANYQLDHWQSKLRDLGNAIRQVMEDTRSDNAGPCFPIIYNVGNEQDHATGDLTKKQKKAKREVHKRVLHYFMSVIVCADPPPN